MIGRNLSLINKGLFAYSISHMLKPDLILFCHNRNIYIKNNMKKSVIIDQILNYRRENMREKFFNKEVYPVLEDLILLYVDFKYDMNAFRKLEIEKYVSILQNTKKKDNSTSERIIKWFYKNKYMIKPNLIKIGYRNLVKMQILEFKKAIFMLSMFSDIDVNRKMDRRKWLRNLKFSPSEQKKYSFDGRIFIDFREALVKNYDIKFKTIDQIHKENCESKLKKKSIKRNRCIIC